MKKVMEAQQLIDTAIEPGMDSLIVKLVNVNFVNLKMYAMSYCVFEVSI